MPRDTLLSTATKIIDSLPVDYTISIAELARKSGVSWATANRWLELILFIQKEPVVDRMKTSQGFEFKRKDRGRGRPARK